MRILVACEYSQVVCTAFRNKGHEAYSCDILPCEGGLPEWHIQDDVLKHLDDGWDMMIAHPPCTHLAVSGAAWFKNKVVGQKQALEFVKVLMNADIEKICIENPVSVISSRIKKPSQIIHPWQFGHMEQKTTCLWLKNLPRLKPTKVVHDQMMLLQKRERERNHYCSPGPDRWKIRSRTYQGIAYAMADQWGNKELLEKYIERDLFEQLNETLTREE